MCKSGFRKISNDSVLRYSILLVVLFFCASLHKMDAALASSSLEQVTIATVPTPASAPIFLAHDLEIFERHNLDVSMKLFETDFEALDTMMAGGCDFAATTGFMVAAKAFFTSEFRILATIAKADIYRIVALNSER
ncbi:MAG: ABC transporter substrate-binding protein, partial [Desulfovibrionales bacterium]